MSRDLARILSNRSIPVFNASMAGAAGGQLALAVSEAGGIGMLGIPAAPDLEALGRTSQQLAQAKACWGAGFLAFALEADSSPLELVLAHEPTVISLGFGSSEASVAAVQESSSTLLLQVGNAEELQAAIAAQPDGIIVRGAEGGGHGRNEVSTLTMLQYALEITEVPIIAGGGVTTARGLAAVMAAGAVAAWIGTRFAVARESDFPDKARQRLVAAEIGGTVYTRAFDIAQGAAWPAHYGGRALVNDFSERWHEHLDELQTTIAHDGTGAMLSARKAGNFDIGPIYAGEGSGLIQRVESAAEIIADLAHYRDILRAAADA